MYFYILIAFLAWLAPTILFTKLFLRKHSDLANNTGTIIVLALIFTPFIFYFIEWLIAIFIDVDIIENYGNWKTSLFAGMSLFLFILTPIIPIWIIIKLLKKERESQANK